MYDFTLFVSSFFFLMGESFKFRRIIQSPFYSVANFIYVVCVCVFFTRNITISIQLISACNGELPLGGCNWNFLIFIVKVKDSKPFCFYLLALRMCACIYVILYIGMKRLVLVECLFVCLFRVCLFVCLIDLNLLILQKWIIPSLFIWTCPCL